MLRRTNIQLIDFGLAMFMKDSDGKQTRKIQARRYRAPEVALGLSSFIRVPKQSVLTSLIGLEWTKAVDVFGAAAIIGELRFGKPLFLGSRDDQFHLAQLHLSLFMGPMPPELAVPGAKLNPSWFKGTSHNQGENPSECISKSKSNGTDALRSKITPEGKVVDDDKSRNKLKLENENRSKSPDVPFTEVKFASDENSSKNEEITIDHGESTSGVIGDHEQDNQELSAPEFDLEEAMTVSEREERIERVRFQKV